ncbi:MAG: (2,3-dihydroxybenzoyl)adenylate synthase [Candidatus Dormibacteraceae bacterium]
MLEGVTPHPPEIVERYRAAGWWEGRPLWDQFAAVIDRFADRVALVTAEGEEITYRQVGRRAEAIAAGLGSRLRPQDRVVVQLPNGPEFVCLYLALQRLGAIPIMALPAHRETEIGHFIELGGALLYVHSDPGLAAVVAAAHPEVSVLAAPDLPEGDPAGLEPRFVDPLDPCVLLLSGGTTGLPKLIPRSHDDYWYNSIAAGAVNDIRPGDALLAVLPPGHNFPLACPGLQSFLQKGCRVILSPATAPALNFELIARHRVTHLELVPALLIRWLDDESAPAADLTSVRIVNTGGHRLQPEVKRRAEERMPGATVQEVFGMAEGLLNFVRLDDPESERRATAGRPVSPGDEIRLVDEAGADVPPGAVGELLCRGPYTIRGYFRAAEHNALAFTPDGFYRTGDLVRLTEFGNLVVEGRKKDLINRAGEKISAEEIENLILGHPAVSDVACVPVPDPVLGERMCACVVLRSGWSLTLEELVAHLNTRGIARFKLPERLLVLAELPKTSVGKVSKKDLAPLAAAGTLSSGPIRRPR